MLFVCPDYVSHFFPMSTLAAECRRRGMAVTIATGPGLQPLVASMGYAHAELILGPGNNAGVMRTEEQARNEAAHMRTFFDATRKGAVETLLYQSRAREHDMLWHPHDVYARLSDLIAEIRPHHIVVDQLAYGATLALHALQIPFVSFLPANPSSLPGVDEVFGFPTRLPPAINARPDEWLHLRQICREIDARFTERFNDVLMKLAPAVPPVPGAFHFTSPWLVLLNYPRTLGCHRLTQLPSRAHFIGSCVREESVDPTFEAAAAGLDPARPTVYVSLGTFLSAREDVLLAIAGALRRVNAQCIMATGSAGTHLVSGLPEDWIVRPIIPQIAALRRAALVISHGGNNTVTEALTDGVPLLVLPFSSDQFDSAADLEAARLGSVLDPNQLNEGVLASRIVTLLHDEKLRGRTREVARDLQLHPGYETAADLLSSVPNATLEASSTAVSPVEPA